MNNRIKNHVGILFQNAPQTKKILEMKEELLSNLNSRYEDLISQGLSEEESYQRVIASIGDVGELMRQIENEAAFNHSYLRKDNKRNAVLITVSVVIFVLSLPATAMVDEFSGRDWLTTLAFFGINAIGIALLLYNYLTKPKYIKENESLVEEFKEWKSGSEKSKVLRKSISSILWLMIVIIYLFTSLTLGFWHLTWIIFVIGALIESIINLVFDINKK